MAENIYNKPCEADFCDCLVHPFQKDPGVSQGERVMDILLDNSPKIDARKMADLLDYFRQLSSHINYYDENLIVSDWQPFFEKSIPFTLSSVIKFNAEAINEKFEFYNLLFEKNPSKPGLQLSLLFIFYNTIKKINDWYSLVKESGLPIERNLESLIKSKLQEPLKDFICLNNIASKYYCTKRIDFSKFSENEIWGFSSGDLIESTNCANLQVWGKKKRLKAIHDKATEIFPSFLEAIKILSVDAELSLEESLFPLKAELQKNHQPHLALIFAFLKLLEKLQGDLNFFTKKHLDFFYKEILKIKPKAAEPDKAHIVFEIQKELKNYLLEKGIKVKDGKDVNKQEILFGLNDEILITKAQVKDIRTLYLNNQVIPNPVGDGTNVALLEGVYIAPDATKADGIDKDFQTDIKNYYTVGNKESKYVLPGTNIFKPYPNARLGFILASPVLLLNEGRRTVTITLQCKLNDECAALITSGDKKSDPCCIETNSVKVKSKAEKSDFSLFDYKILFDYIQKAIRYEYILINEELIDAASKKGITNEILEKIRNVFLTETCVKDTCCKKQKKFNRESFVKKRKWIEFLNKSVNAQFGKDILNEIFKPKRVFKILFSGEKEWIEPSEINNIEMSDLISDTFTLTIITTLNADKDSVTFYNKDNLKEDFNETMPLVKIELEESLGIKVNQTFRKEYKKYLSDALEGNLNKVNDECCLLKNFQNCFGKISFYHFFRNVSVIDKIGTDATQIDVKVCGLKNFIVQNDESVMDVNGAILPFGSRPKIGSNFYIGCKEIFYKNWRECWINLNWKDRPINFQDYYLGYQNDLPPKILISDFDNKNFQVEKSLLNQGTWIPDKSEKIFLDTGDLEYLTNSLCNGATINYYTHLHLLRGEYSSFMTVDKDLLSETIKNLNVNTRNGFLKLTLKNQPAIGGGSPVDFQHTNYPFILARQMVAFGKLPNETVDGAVYYDSIPIPPGSPIVFDSSQIKDDIHNAFLGAARIDTDVNNSQNGINRKAAGASGTDIVSPKSDDIRNVLGGSPPNLTLDAAQVNALLSGVDGKIADISKFAAIIPNEPWTPIISNMALDYTATATLTDITLIHLYPYTGTYKHEEIQLEPTLFPTFCDEGTLFLGLENLIPGNNLNLLFQLAEATADSESEKEDVHWHYLDSNVWKSLRFGFEVLEDATDDLTTSGIVKFALPENMTNKNTVMPAGLHWIKATIPKNSKSVSETTGIHAQAISVTFTNEDANDRLRLDKPIEAGQIAKLEIADASIKKTDQPYNTFGGKIPEEQKLFYVRVSELLRHKGRAIQKFDYERIVLDAFPEIFKTKCINHSFGLNAHQYKNDFPFAPGYVLQAMIPNLNILKAGNAFEPKVPVSILEKIDAHIRKRTSAFAHFRAMNPRYEKIHFCITVKLIFGKDENYYREKLKKDISEFLAPWAIGDYYKLTFAQCVNRSEIIGFIEHLGYVDFISELNMRHDDDNFLVIAPVQICPKTPRSILIAGDIDVCIDKECDQWGDVSCDNKPQPIIEYCIPPSDRKTKWLTRETKINS